MVIVIEKEDSATLVQEKLKEADRAMKDLMRQEILSLCGVLTNTTESDPVTVIRKIRDDEWS